MTDRTAIEPEVVDLTHLDASIPCGYTGHAKIGSTGPAVWVVWVRRHCPVDEVIVVFWCNQCWTRRSTNRSIRCEVCHVPVEGGMGRIVRVERIRQ